MASFDPRLHPQSTKTCIGAAKPEMGSTADVKVTATAATKFITLNERWRVRLDNPLQWILQRQQGHNADGSPRYRDRAFCTQRRTLLRDIGDYCGDVDPAAVRQVEALPEKFPYEKKHR